MMRYCLSAWIIVAMLLSTSVAMAKVRVAIVDITAKSKYSKRIVPEIKRAFNKRSGVRVIEKSNFSKKLRKYKLNYKILSRKKSRNRYTTRFRRALKKENIDALVIVEAQSQGSKVQVIIMGASGEELADSTTKTRRKQLSKKRARALARRGTQLIRDDMEEISRQKKTKTSVVASKTKTKTTTTTIKKRRRRRVAPEPEEKDSILLDDGIWLGAGLSFGRRTLESLDDKTALTHVAPYIGPTLRASFALLFLEDKAQLDLSGYFAYAPFNTVFVDTNGDTQQLDSRIIRTGGQLAFNYGLFSVLAAGIYGGFDYLSVGVSPNTTYIGHDYKIARIGLQAMLQPVEQVNLTFGAGYLPWVNYVYGAEETVTAASTVGFELHTSLGMQISDNLNARAAYHFSTLSPAADDPAETTDDIHQGSIMVGWTF